VEGFRLEVGTIDATDPNSRWRLETVYDWSLMARLQQLKEEITQVSAKSENIVPQVKERIKNWTPKVLEQEAEIDYENVRVEAFLYSTEPPSETQKQQLIEFLKDKYNNDVTLTWKEDRKLVEGFRLEVGTIDLNDPTSRWKLESIYDWSLMARLQQLKEELSQISVESDNVVPLIKETIKNWTPKALEK